MDQIVHDVLTKILSQYGGASKLEEIVGQGSVNRVFKAQTAHGMFIIRLREYYASALSEYEKETWCIKQATRAGIPSPKVFTIGILEDCPYMLQEYLEGETLQNSTHNSVWKELGAYASKINKIPTNGYGLEFREEEDGTGIFLSSFCPSWESHLQYNIDSLQENDPISITYKLYNIQQTETIKKIFEELKQRKFLFGLVHGDLSPRNVISSPSQCLSLIDWGCALSHITPHYELISVLRNQRNNGQKFCYSTETFKQFLEGYGIGENEWLEIRRDVCSILLLSSFDTLRWAIDKSPDSIPGSVEELQYALELFFNLDSNM